MRILFDNGTPRQLRRQLFGHEIETAMERGWDTLANGVLLDRAEEAGYEVGYQQNMSNRRVVVVVLMNTAWPRISRRTEAIRKALEGIQPGELRDVHIAMRGEV